MKDISEDLKKFFKKKKLTQKQIAEILDVAQPYVARLINQKDAFGKTNANKWGEKFGLNPVWLLTGEGDMYKPAETRSVDEVKDGGMATLGDQSPIYKDVKFEIEEELNSDYTMPSELEESNKEIQKLRKLLSAAEKEVARLEGKNEEQDKFIKMLMEKNEMARNVTDLNRRDAEILLSALKLIKDNGGEMKYSAIKEELPKHFQFSEKELVPKRTWEHLWHAVLGMVGYIELKQTGIIDARKGVWSLTKDGEAALSLSPEDFYKLYHYRYLDIQRAKAAAKQSMEAIATETKPIEEVAETDIETLQEKAREQIRQYIIRKDPYEFQNMVAALFRAMGYFTPFVAPKGRDGGVDVIAYCDPLGVKKPHIKVQVKHYPSNPISVDVIRSLTGMCKNADEMGFVITSGSFTNEAQRESRSLHNNIRLIDGEDFIDLWTAYYGNMPDEDKALMPIVPIYHLNIN